MDKIKIDIFTVKPEVQKIIEFKETEIAEVHRGNRYNDWIANVFFGENNWTVKTETFINGKNIKKE